MKKYFGYIALCILITTFSGCPQNTQIVNSQPEPAPLPRQNSQQATPPEQPEKPQIDQIPDDQVPDPDDQVPDIDEPAEINEPNLIIPREIPITQPQQIIKRSTSDFHNICASILKNYINEEGKVNYPGLRRKRLELIDLLKEFKKLEPKEYNDWPKEEKIAFWINAYNINLLKIIVDNYPIQSYRMLHILPTWGPDSVRHIDKRIQGIKNQKFIIMEEEFTLDEIEKRLFKTEFDDPRIFFAVSFYATTSGPPFRNEPYTGKKLNEQLDEQVKKFLLSKHGLKIDREEKIVYISSLFDEQQFGKEFLKKYETNKKFKDQSPVNRAVLNFCINYLTQNQINYLETQRYKIKFIFFDWNLNGQ
ncbi:MAG: DUF547 domain-containing protein [Planctomycetota bacterium]|jgi:hypothetical protein